MQLYPGEKNTIYLYGDTGAGQLSLFHTSQTFKKLFSQYKLKIITAAEVTKGLWQEKAALFIMPGGADLGYLEKLQGLGNKIIKKYVEEGGSFLGICAGSYYASARVEFDKNGPLKVIGYRELAFFKGTAIGPLLASYDYQSASGSRAATIQTIYPSLKAIKLFYNGGGFFDKAAIFPQTKVIASYGNQSPAIIFINYGAGKVLLSGLHFEYDPFLLDMENPYISKFILALQKNNQERKVLIKELMILLGLNKF